MEDLAIALNATIGADPADPATRAVEGRELPDFVAALDEQALSGARIGIFEPLFGDDPEDAAVGEVVRDALRRMEALGATVVSVDMPEYQSLIAGSSLIGHEFKWDLMDYLAGVPDAPVGSLGEMIELGLIHDAVIGTMRRWDEPEDRSSDEYAAALTAREALNEAILALMNARSLDVIAYPTIRRVAARIGEPQRGSGCQLSAHTGLPALAIPAGWTDELPVGMEIVGRPFDDARLVALGYAFEQATGLRRGPAITPPLRTAGSTATTSTEIRASTGPAEVRGRFDYDPAASRLEYSTEVLGVPSADIHAVVLRHADDEGRWSVAAQLSGPGALESSGRLALNETLRAQLEAGRLFLELVTRGRPVTTVRSPVVFPPS